ncbi:hypothetical protein FC30_GL000976 [Ligilactobacillus animalis KCTC 3501 = DSM 20602]|nr:hypothetical protein FC30_GL000976 [Ligilactobacillus animalis KCTC 3501 = DSM 20602]
MFLKYVATNIPTSVFTQKIADDIVILKNSALKGGKYMFYEIEFNAKLAEAAKKARAKGIAEGRTEGRAEGYTKEETLTAVTHLTSSTVEEAEALYDKLFAK